MTKIDQRTRVRRMLKALYGDRFLTYSEEELATVVPFKQRVISKVSATKQRGKREAEAEGKSSISDANDPVTKYRTVRQNEVHAAKQFIDGIDFNLKTIANAEDRLEDQRDQLEDSTAKVAAAWDALSDDEKLAFTNPHPCPQTALDYPIYAGWEFHHFPRERSCEQDRQIRDLELVLRALDRELGD